MGTEILTSANSDVFIVKLDASGDLIWARNVGGSTDEQGYGIATDNSNNVYVTGGFASTGDFDPGVGVFNLTSSGSRDGFILKLDEFGDFVWAKSFGGADYDFSRNIAVDESGNIYATGEFEGTADFDPGAGTENIVSEGFRDIFLLKLNSSGDFTWAHGFGSTSLDVGLGLDTDDDGNIYATGIFRDIVDFDPGAGVSNLTSAGAGESFTLKLDPSGNFDWAYKIGDTSEDGGNAIHISEEGSVYATGFFYNTIDLDPAAPVSSVTSVGSMDIYIQKLLVCLPESISPDLASLPDLEDECSVDMPISPTASNCSGTYNGIPDLAFPITEQGTTVVTWTYDDGNGNTTTQTQNIIITDITGPVADIPDLPDVTAECEVSSLTPPAATDNCIGAVVGTTDAELPITDQGTTIVTWAYDDGHGNITTQTQNIIITDITEPVADAEDLPEVTAECEVSSLTPPTATDNCSGTIIGTLDTPLPITDVGTTTVTWTYDDGNGNTSTQTQNIIVTPIDISTSVELTGDNYILSADSSGYTYQWVENCGTTYDEIVGATDQSYTPTLSGSYAVIISNGACSDTSECININDLQIAETITNPQISLYPNPTTQAFRIEFGTEAESGQIIIFNALGEIVYAKAFYEEKVFDVELLGASGFYLVQVNIENGSTIFKKILKD